jgi:hypothetical protein
MPFHPKLSALEDSNQFWYTEDEGGWILNNEIPFSDSTDCNFYSCNQMRWLTLNLIIFFGISWLFSTPLLLVEVQVVQVILGFIVNSCDIQSQIFVKFMLKNSTYLQGSYLWIVSSVAENGYNSPHSSPKAWVALLPPFSSPLLILITFFDNESFSTYSFHYALVSFFILVVCLPCTYLSLNFLFHFLFLLVLLAFSFLS